MEINMTANNYHSIYVCIWSEAMASWAENDVTLPLCVQGRSQDV